MGFLGWDVLGCARPGGIDLYRREENGKIQGRAARGKGLLLGTREENKIERVF